MNRFDIIYIATFKGLISGVYECPDDAQEAVFDYLTDNHAEIEEAKSELGAFEIYQFSEGCKLEGERISLDEIAERLKDYYNTDRG